MNKKTISDISMEEVTQADFKRATLKITGKPVDRKQRISIIILNFSIYLKKYFAAMFS
ncbi:MAG: hypothetical protein KKD44_21065 [Proteobacteria bacterium]|nr:hypothetical protein [Pseudomonadota bacterium]